MAYITTKGLRKAIRKITKNAMIWDQSNFCGTTRCVAGHAVEDLPAKFQLNKDGCDIVRTAVEAWGNCSPEREKVMELLFLEHATLQQIDEALKKVEQKEK